MSVDWGGRDVVTKSPLDCRIVATNRNKSTSRVRRQYECDLVRRAVK